MSPQAQFLPPSTPKILKIYTVLCKLAMGVPHKLLAPTPHQNILCETLIAHRPDKQDLTLIIHEMLRKTRQGNTTQQKDKATQHNSPKAIIFQRKISCLGWDLNPRPSICTYHTDLHTKHSDHSTHIQYMYNMDGRVHVIHILLVFTCRLFLAQQRR